MLCSPAADLLSLSRKLLAAVGESLLYARADWVRGAAGAPLLMDPEAAVHFVSAFLAFV